MGVGIIVVVIMAFNSSGKVTTVIEHTWIVHFKLSLIMTYIRTSTLKSKPTSSSVEVVVVVAAVVIGGGRSQWWWKKLLISNINYINERKIKYGIF